MYHKTTQATTGQAVCVPSSMDSLSDGHAKTGKGAIMLHQSVWICMI